ncbi:hypothetical protein [Paenibacillus solani]|uniref:hypothetical protein n=1 Tax=Paenibacillus solani TaxID=1705565 RepID=UPI003D2C811F
MMILIARTIVEEKMEWLPMDLGMISVPLALVGIFIFGFPDWVTKIWTFSIYRTMKPNYEFEENIEYKKPKNSTIIIIKIIGAIFIIFGVYLFWNAETFYNTWVNKYIEVDSGR